jgi:two-component system, OmpR family, response regulator
MRALIVEDDPDVATDVARALSTAGFVTDVCTDGEAAWFRGETEDYDVAVLDLGLPRLDGLSVLRRWREEHRAFPVLILSARSQWREKVEGIEAGADDYLAKPFQMGELIARVRGLVRRAAGRTSFEVEIGALTINTHRLTATYRGAPLRLTPLEFRLLDYLSHQSGRAVHAGELAEHLYGCEDPADTNAIEALVTRLRRKVGADCIETRRGFGYALGRGE